MIDTFMAVWNRYHRTHGIKLLLTWLLIGISLLSLLIMAGMASQGSFPHQARYATTRHNKETSVTITALVGRERGSVTATPDHDKGQQTRPCAVKVVRKKRVPADRRMSTISHGNVPRPVRAPTSPTPLPTSASLPTMTPTATDKLEPTPTEDRPLPEPTDDDNTPGWDPTDIILLPPEKTVVSTITPAPATVTSTATLVASPTGSDDNGTGVSGFADGTVGHAGRKKTDMKTVKNADSKQRTGLARSAARCLSNNVNMAMDKGNKSENIAELVCNAAIVLGSVVLVALLFYGALCAAYVFKQKRELS